MFPTYQNFQLPNKRRCWHVLIIGVILPATSQTAGYISMKPYAVTIGFVCLALPLHASCAAERLPSFTVDLAESSVSGLSSGAYMAGQFHVAFSSTLKGAAMIAGGPYGCALGQLPIALNQCMQTSLGAPDPLALLERARSFEREGRIDPLSHLLDDQVYVFSGREDDTVIPPVVDQTVAFYLSLIHI